MSWTKTRRQERSCFTQGTVAGLCSDAEYLSGMRKDPGYTICVGTKESH